MVNCRLFSQLRPSNVVFFDDELFGYVEKVMVLCVGDRATVSGGF